MSISRVRLIGLAALAAFVSTGMMQAAPASDVPSVGYSALGTSSAAARRLQRVFARAFGRREEFTHSRRR